MEGESSVFMFDGQMIDISKLSEEEIENLIEKVDNEIKRLEGELDESLFEEVSE